MNLWDLGIKHNTVKCYERFPYSHCYCKDYYPFHLEDRRDTIRAVLELGVAEGGSLRMWQEYFPNANIYGIDKRNTFENHGEERIYFRQGEQQDVEFLHKVRIEEPSWDLIIDDGGHRAHNIQTSYETLWPFVSPGGLYAIEDVMNKHHRSIPVIAYFYNLINLDFPKYKTPTVTGIKRVTFHTGGLIVIEKEGQYEAK